MAAAFAAAIVALTGSRIPVGAAPAVVPRMHAEAPATAVDIRSPSAQSSPAMVADPTEPRFVALAHRVDAPDFDCALQLSGDGGASWVPGRPVPVLPRGAEKCFAPEVAFDGDGVLHYLFVGLRGRGNVPMGAFLVTSDDRGRSFSRPRRLLGPNAFGVRMAVDRSRGGPGRLHLVWLQASAVPPLGGFPAPPNPILAAYSDDGGETLSKPRQVSDPGRLRVVAPALALAPDGAVHVAYYDLGDDARDYHGLEGPTWEGSWSIVHSRSTDGGLRFSRGTVVDAAIQPPERVILVFTMPTPGLVAAPRGQVHVAWTDRRGGDWDVLMRRSPDGGRSWEEARRLNDDAPGNGRHQYLPRLAVAPGGRLDAVFYDRRDDPENLRHHVYLASSSDGGRNFAANLRLSRESSDSRVGARYRVPSATGMVDVGSRLGLLSDDARATAAWADARNTFGPPDDVAGPTGLDVYTAVVVFGSSAGADGRRGAGASGGGSGGASGGGSGGGIAPWLALGAAGAFVVGAASWGIRRARTPATAARKPRLVRREPGLGSGKPE